MSVPEPLLPPPPSSVHGPSNGKEMRKQPVRQFLLPFSRAALVRSGATLSATRQLHSVVALPAGTPSKKHL